MGDIKVNPEGYDKIIQKYQEQQDRNLKVILDAKGAKTQDELLEIEKKTIAEQNARKEDVVPLKDRTIKTRAKSPEINALEEQLRKQIESVALGAMPQVSQEDQQAGAAPLSKDRFQQGAPRKETK